MLLCMYGTTSVLYIPFLIVVRLRTIYTERYNNTSRDLQYVVNNVTTVNKRTIHPTRCI